ncbi:inverse autotransporter beta domain-containing protein [Campylobacter jejuni]|uniref:inverse autotransporter beta domain-containing protein n=1 Tax=Campylobacter jejuni TaxID=197 RepID=UPI000576F36C|nr:inverse autotransporter beta-barrel domain-containing protein [Campylobacter jejuni]
MRGIFYIIALFSLLNADELTEALAKNNNQNSWEHFDYKNTKEAPKIQEENVDFKNTFDSLLSKTLENNNGIDKTDGNLDFQNENAQVKNLSSLYEGENNSLLFQKELFVAQDNYNYSGGLINRYEKDDFLFGVNGFIDKQKEQKDTKSFGTEFSYSKFIKAYSNYYISNEAEKNLQLGMSFVIPAYTAFTFDISKDNDKTNYQVSYSPYSVFSLNLLRRDYSARETIDDTVVQVGFSFNFNEGFLKQFRKKDNTLEEVNRYDFLQRTH